MMIFSFIFFILGSLGMGVINSKHYWLSFIVFSSLLVGLIFSNVDFIDLEMESIFSLDMVSFSLVLLSMWVSMMMFLSSSSIYSSKMNLFLFYSAVVILCLTLLITFFVLNLIMFYFFFEVSLIPTLLIIMGWGYQPERMQAGIYFLFYTLTASLPLLVSLIWFNHDQCVLNFYLIYCSGFDSLGGFLVFIFFLLAFLVKLPMFFVHLWLPKAHVEAPVSGSMILAGVLLKLGGYGLYRLTPICLESVKFYGNHFFGLSIMGMVYVGLICCRLNDLKALVAYSSVAHMGLVICGVLSFYFWGLEGALMMMLGHGLASSGLFCVVNMYYERTGSRSFFLNSGLLNYLPLFTLLFFMLCVSNMAAPPTLNLASEIFLMGGMMKFNYFMVMFFPLGSYLGAVFTLILFSYSQHGRFYISKNSFNVGSLREYNLFMMHLIPINYVILNIDFYCYII